MKEGLWTVIENLPDGQKLEILGQEYTAWNYDWYIYDALDLVAKWKPAQRTFARVMMLREWIRENYQHGHNIPYKHIRSVSAAKAWLEMVVESEYRYASSDWAQARADARQRVKHF